MELATQAAMAGNLPSNWGSKLDPDGDRYFWPLDTKEVTWDPPIDEMVALLEGQQREELEAIYKKAAEETPPAVL